MKSAKATKPVVILKGGRSNQGRLAAASHTGALAGDDRAWDALAAQTPVLLVSTVDEFIDVLLMLQHVDAAAGAADHGGDAVRQWRRFERSRHRRSSPIAGLDVSPFGDEARLPLEALKLPPGTSVANPIDTPVRDPSGEGRMGRRRDPGHRL